MVLRPHASTLRRQQATRDRQPHPRSEALLPPLGPAIEPFEQVFEVGDRQTDAAVAHPQLQLAGDDRHVDVDHGSWRRILCGVLENMGER